MQKIDDASSFSMSRSETQDERDLRDEAVKLYTTYRHILYEQKRRAEIGAPQETDAR